MLAHRTSVLDAEPEEVQAAVVESVKYHPLYGTSIFHVRKHKFPARLASLPADCILALNALGLHFLSDARVPLATFTFDKIATRTATTTTLAFRTLNRGTEGTDGVSVFTSQAADILGLWADYEAKLAAAGGAGGGGVADTSGKRRS